MIHHPPPETALNEGTEVLRLLFLRRKFIMLTALLGAIMSILVSMPVFMPPVYLSESIIYPPASYSDKINADFDLRFGADKEIDEHIQVLKSAVLRDSIIRKFNLLKHYDIDADDEHKFSKLYREFESNFSIERTRYNSISVTVYDTDAKLAADMCNAMIRIGDKVKASIMRQNLLQTMVSLETATADALRNLEQTESRITAMDPSVNLNSTGLAAMNGAERFRAQLQVIDMIGKAKREGNNPLLRLLYDYENGQSKYNTLKDSHDKAMINLNARLVNSYIISPAEIPDRKHSPKRSLIVLCSVLVCIVLASAYVVAKERLMPLSGIR